ncbi:acyltransferase [Aquabacterium fontiphilum]|jgi:1-acyl-sn-glycerol-3-phosphate acyltransferase|uniref:acyltransferase n=1 Tax=Aquabacterium fontiphilum TaxID=450365 RepID=UPI00137817E6|nr:acyltransferase [Aquabacterium fontiphilum]NBD20304.1 acyltransferase [Aquabacterium fontiphilum]
MKAIKAVFACLVLVLNILVHISLLLPVALIKLLLPWRPVRRVVDAVLGAIAESWIGVNKFWMWAVGRTRWQIQGADGLRAKGWYLVSCNHQSWVDILVLQWVFNRKIPLLKFFIKHELIYVPIMGLAWWALDFPFMKRRGGASAQKDLETARKACEKFKVIPTSVISFMEGTRFTPAKHDQQHSPFRNLLKPKTGGVGMSLETMGDLFDGLLDVTIVYPKGVPTFVDLLTGSIDEVIVTARLRPIPPELLSAARGQGIDRTQLQNWVNALWEEKDAEIDALKASALTRPAR